MSVNTYLITVIILLFYSLYDAYSKCSDEKERESLLSSIRFGASKRYYISLVIDTNNPFLLEGKLGMLSVKHCTLFIGEENE